MPGHFQTETFISGVMAQDVHTLNAVLGATIEDQAVVTLNTMRSVWDPENKYSLYNFVRQPQTFPDVLLRRPPGNGSADEIILGLEMKGWYVLAKEGEPNYRFDVTEAACNVHDLIAVVPWALSQVVSGRPIIFVPFLESARYAAEYRNFWWKNLRRAKSSVDIKIPKRALPYPVKSDSIRDIPDSDTGGNFGRIARSGLMDDYLEAVKGRPLCGIEVRHWLTFFSIPREAR